MAPNLADVGCQGRDTRSIGVQAGAESPRSWRIVQKCHVTRLSILELRSTYTLHRRGAAQQAASVIDAITLAI